MVQARFGLAFDHPAVIQNLQYSQSCEFNVFCLDVEIALREYLLSAARECCLYYTFLSPSRILSARL